MMTRFADIVGHADAIAVFRRARARGRMHHAWLLNGPEGVGKHTFSRAAAALVECESAPLQDDADACGECGGCRRLASGNHPDVVTIAPDGRFIKIDQVREVLGLTRYRPYEGRIRVIIIDGVDRLKEEAANALLKTLEEPSGETMFFCIASQPQRVMSTIRSRCQPLQFGRLHRTQLEQILLGRGVAVEAAKTASRLGDGSVVAAMAVLDSPVAAQRHALNERVATLAHAGAAEVVRWAKDLADDKDHLGEVLNLIRLLYRDAMLVQAGASHLATNSDALEPAARLATDRSRQRLVASIARIDAIEAMLLGNVNARLAMESLLFELRA